ncbi:hypothetical protein FI146_90002 [Flavobacterium psychrophilum]|nr:hypothetical protein FI146_90002 [Flavobacterium psychrophilum]
MSSKLGICSCWREIPCICCMLKNAKFIFFKLIILVIFDRVCGVFSQTDVIKVQYFLCVPRELLVNFLVKKKYE